MQDPFDYALAAEGAQPRRRVLLGLFGVAVVALSAPISSRELHPGIIGDDNRVRVEQRGPPWDAVGQVNVGGYRRVGQCKGTLIAPEVVLTAAHCVVDPCRAAPFPLHDIHFLAGVHGAEKRSFDRKVPAFLGGLRVSAERSPNDASTKTCAS